LCDSTTLPDSFGLINHLNPFKTFSPLIRMNSYGQLGRHLAFHRLGDTEYDVASAKTSTAGSKVAKVEDDPDYEVVETSLQG
jgi:hypothetical protein